MTKRKSNRKTLSIAAAITLSLSGISATREKYLASIKCDAPGTNGLFIVKDKSSYANAAAACAAHGGSLADLTNDKFASAAEMISTCANSDKTWIGSWNYKPGSTESQDCLTAHITSKNSGGSIDQMCEGENAVLCQTHTSNVPHNPNHIQKGPGTHISVLPLPDNGRKDNWIGGGGYSRIYGGGPIGPFYGGSFQIPPFPQYGHSYGIPPPLPYGYHGGWKHRGDSHQCKADGSATVTVTELGTAPTTVTVLQEKPITVTEAGPALSTLTNYEHKPVTITEPGEKVTVTVPGSDKTTVTEIQKEHVTITEPAVTITAPAPDPVTITKPAPITEPITSTVTLPAQTITITEKGKVQTVTVPPITTTITIDVPKTITVPTLVTVEATPTTVTEHVTDHVTNVETNKVTEYMTNTLTLTELTTKTNTITDSFTEFKTQTELKTLDPATVTLEASTVTLEANTVTLKPETVTLGGSTITLPPNTVTLPPDTVTLPPNTVTLPASTVTLEASTVTLPKETSLITLPASTSIFYAVRDVVRTSTYYQQLPPQTVNHFITTTYTTTYLSIKMLTNTVTDTITTTSIPPPVTATVTEDCSFDTSSNSDEWIFPFEIKGFNGAGIYTLKNNGVVQVNAGGTYTFLSGGPPGGGPSRGSVIKKNHGSNHDDSGDSDAFVFSFEFPEFRGPGVYTRSDGVISVLGDGSYTWLSGGPPKANSGGFSYSFPFHIPGFKGNPGTFTLQNGAVITVKNDGTYNFISGSQPRDGTPGSGTSAGGVSFSFPFNVPGFNGGPGEYTLDNGAVVTIRHDGTYSVLSGNAPNGAPNTGNGGLGYKYNLPFDLDGFNGPGTYTLRNGAVFSLQPNGFYTFLSGTPPKGVPASGNTLENGGSSGNSGNSGSGSSGNGSFSFPFKVPGFAGQPGKYTLENNAVITVKDDGSYTFLSGSAPQGRGGGRGNGGKGNGGGNSFSFPFSVPGFAGQSGKYTLENNAVITVKNDGSYTFLSGSAPNGSSSGSDSFSFPFSVPGFAGQSGKYTLENNAVITVKDDGSYTFLSGSAPQEGNSDDGSSSSSSTSSGMSPGIYTLSNNAVISVRDDGSFTYLTNPQNSPVSQADYNAFSFPVFARRSPTTAIAN